MKIFEWHEKRQQLLSLLWIFITVNYIYCDVFTLHLAPYLEAFLAGQVGRLAGWQVGRLAGWQYKHNRRVLIDICLHYANSHDHDSTIKGAGFYVK